MLRDLIDDKLKIWLCNGLVLWGLNWIKFDETLIASLGRSKVKVHSLLP